MAVQLENRVTNLENLMAELIQTVTQTSREMQVFKEEMAEFKEEMRISREVSGREMNEFKEEMSKFKENTEAYIQESKAERIEMRRQWGELSNRLGTMAEDLVAPSIPRILRTVLSCPDQRIEFSAVRVRKAHPIDPGRAQEFDVVAVCGDYLLVNETKSKLRPEDIRQFAEEILPEAREFSPEYGAKKIIGCIASLYVAESLVRDGERRGLIVLGFGEDVMEVLNSPEFTPRVF